MTDDAGHHRPDVQGLRAVAVLMVVAFHVGGSPVGGTRPGPPLGPLLRSGFVGVDVFFVVSGFVITAMLLRERARTGRTSYRDFLARRARRLLPALALMTVLVLMVSALVLSPFGPQQFALRTALAANTFVANLYLYRHTGYFDASAAQNPFLHTWSLSVEEQTYLVLPLGLAAAAWIGARRRRRRRLGEGGDGTTAMAIGVTAVSALSLVLMLALWREWRPGGVEAPVRLAFLGTPARLWEFGAGALLALGQGRLERTGRAAAEVAGAAGVVVLAAVALLRDPGAPYPGPVTVAVVAATVLLLVAGTRPTAVARALSARPLVWLGDRSYSWYLWHWPAVVLATVVWPREPLVPLAAAVVSLLPAWAAHRWVEQPLRRDRSVVGWRAVRLGVLCVGGVALVVGIGSAGAARGWGLREADGWYDLPDGRNIGCHLFNRDSDAAFPGEVCATRPPGRSRGDWLVLGDLSADSVATAVVDAAHSLGFGTVQWTRSGCPPVDRVPVHSPRCAEWQRRARELVARTRPALVVLSADSPAYVTDARPEEVVARGDGRHPEGVDGALAEWAAGLRAALDRYRAAGIPVVVVGPTPAFPGEFPRDLQSRLRPRPVLPAPTRAAAAARVARTGPVERQVAAAAGAEYVDPFDRLCGRRCPVLVDGTWWYYDDRHLTKAGSRRLTGDVTAAARRALGTR